MRKVAVIGAGSWGTTVAMLAAAKAPVTLWARRPELAETIRATRVNDQYLPETRVPDNVTPTASLAEAVGSAGAVAVAVPSHGFRAVFRELAPHLDAGVPIVSLTKGIEQETLDTMTAVIAEEAPDHDSGLIGVLTGPNLAAEIVAGQPAAAVVAMTGDAAARAVQETFMGPTFRVYTNDDVVGCELGGALKNVMAIAAGMSDGLGFGDNTRATLITRALAELTRLGVALGGRPSTFAGLAGMGDLIATCISPKSRNHRVGYYLAMGRSLEEIVSEMDMVAEGVKTTASVLGLAERVGVEMPIAEHVSMVIHEGVHPRDAVLSLMSRQAKAEI
ncbi:MAG: NAD(P)-dependent glycerol-3-phosphate dehydrogenase [Actinobacteria bacterium]|nr:NAD(P)-dependent glycerol-3-phosphate dehydrogenase [Actinomycetota bacterium]